jgi:hypothetical protein
METIPKWSTYSLVTKGDSPTVSGYPSTVSTAATAHFNDGTYTRLAEVSHTNWGVVNVGLAGLILF